VALADESREIPEEGDITDVICPIVVALGADSSPCDDQVIEKAENGNGRLL
jgi:hypothetical protein